MQAWPSFFNSLDSLVCLLICTELLLVHAADQSHQISGPPSPLQLSKKGLGIGLGTVVHKAAEAASVLAKQAYAAASSTRKSDVDLIPLKCCLMSIALPWDYIAHDLLFKVHTFGA